MILGITGHRLDKLFGFDMNRPEYRNMRTFFARLFLEWQVGTVICGGALGTDLLAVEEIIWLNQVTKDAAYDGVEIGAEIKIAAPFPGYDSRWNKDDRENLARLQKYCNIVYVSDHYTPYAYQKRNEYIVDRCDVLLAIWDGSASGTKNCIDYAVKQHRPVKIVNPKIFRM